MQRLMKQKVQAKFNHSNNTQNTILEQLTYSIQMIPIFDQNDKLAFCQQSNVTYAKTQLLLISSSTFSVKERNVG